jgi:hypothetical protein
VWRQRILLDWQRRLDLVYAAPLVLIITMILFVISDYFLYCRHAAHRRLQQPERFCPGGDGLPGERAGVCSKRALHNLTCHVTCAQGACVCNWGYVGRACTLLCPGIIGSSAVCSGHGRCTTRTSCIRCSFTLWNSCVQANATAVCECDFGWGGEKCNEMRL